MAITNDFLNKIINLKKDYLGWPNRFR
jgi:hypothetical protein